MADPVDEGTIPDQPASSRATVEDGIDGVTITLPPLGVWRAAHWMFAFGLLWCAIMAFISSFFVPGVVSGKITGYTASPCLFCRFFGHSGSCF